MVLHRRRFGGCFLNGFLFDLSLYLFYPTITCVNLFARLFRPTTKERRLRAENDPCYQFICVFAFAFPFLLAGLLLSLPLSLVGFLFWLPLQFCRRPYVYYEHRYAASSDLPVWAPNTKMAFKIATANVCLLPEFATRANNLNGPGCRAGVIMDKIIEDTNVGKPEVVVMTTEDRIGTPTSQDSLLKNRNNSNVDTHSTDGNLLTETSEAPGSTRMSAPADEKASQRSLYSQHNKVRAMENPILSLKDHRLEPAEIRSKEYDSNLCLASVNHSVAALDNASCDDKTETGSVEDSEANRKMKTSIVGLDETCSINSALMTPGVGAHPHPPVFIVNSAPENGIVDAASESGASFDTVDAVSVKDGIGVKNSNNSSSQIPQIMTNSTPAGFKLSQRDLASQKDGVSLISENLSNFDAIDSVVIGGGSGGGSGGGGSSALTVDTFVHGIDLRFPVDLDFLCLCEVFDRSASKVVLDKLSRHFPFVLYDIAARPSFRFCNSGLLFASKYPILDAEFHRYGAHEGSDSMACKGVLLVKLRVGRLGDGTDVVGYVVQTHIQARVSDRSGDFQLAQLDLAAEDIRKFRGNGGGGGGESGDKEIVCFDLLSGDLNFDSVSDSDKTRWAHPLFSELYVDPCRESSGADRPWTVGTELLQPSLYDDEVCTPEALRATLFDNETRAQFVASTEHDGSDNQNGKRRIDYICYGREQSGRFSTDLKRFSFITSLASLTDHLPIAMQFDVNLD